MYVLSHSVFLPSRSHALYKHVTVYYIVCIVNIHRQPYDLLVKNVKPNNFSFALGCKNNQKYTYIIHYKNVNEDHFTLVPTVIYIDTHLPFI